MAEKNPTDTLLVSFEGTLSTSLSHPKEKYLRLKEEKSVWGGELQPGLGGCVQFHFRLQGLVGNNHFCPTPLLYIILVRLPVAPPPCCRSPPPLHLSPCCKEEQQQLNRLFYSPNSLYENRIDHSSPLLV